MAIIGPKAVSVLFSPNAVAVIDLFRAFGSPDGHSGVAAMDRLELELTRMIGPESARAAVSDSLLFSFALRRKREQPLHFNPLHTRQGTADEFCLMTLVGAAAGANDELMADAGFALGISGEGPLISLANDISTSLKTLPFKTAFLGEDIFEAVMGSELEISEAGRAAFEGSYVKFNFNP